MIQNNYFYIIDDNINVNEFILFYSIIKIQKADNLFLFHKNKLDNVFFKNLKDHQLWSEFNTNINFIKIEENNESNIFQYINNYGGIYLMKCIYILRKIEKFLIYDYVKLDNIFIGLKKNSNIFNFNDFNNIEYTFEISNTLLINYENTNKIIFDYNFNEYFEIIYNKYFINIIDENYKLIIDNLLNSKITTINLIIYYILGYDKYFNKVNINKNNFSKINIIDKIYYINMELSKSRNNNTINTLNNFHIKHERYNAIDGINNKNIKQIYFENKNIKTYNTNEEYAVLASHLSLINKLRYEKGNYYLIFEDDLSLDFIEYWDEDLEKIINNAPKDAEIIMLAYFTLNHKFEKDNNYRKWNNDWSALSYIIKKSCINKLDDYIIDNKFKLYDDINVADNYIFRLFNTYLYKYPLFTFMNNNSSTFHKDHDLYQKIYKNLNLIILNDIINKYFNIP